MEVHVVGQKNNQSNTSGSSGKQGYRQFRSDPKWLVFGGLILSGVSALGFFAAQIIFTLLSILGIVIAIWGAIQWVVRLFQR